MNKRFNLQTGKLGEAIAKEYLEKKGFKILEQNARSRYGEIDLVCQQGKELVVVEVRTKIGEDFGTPEESLTKKKLRKLRLNAMAKRADRADAVCIVLKSDLSIEQLNHYENIV